MNVSLAEIATWVAGQVHGPHDLVIRGAAPLADAQSGEISFADGDSHQEQLRSTGAAAVLVPEGFVSSCDLPYLAVTDVRAAFADIVSRFRPNRDRGRIGISPAAHVSPTAVLEEDVDVYPGAFIGDAVQIGRGSTIHSGARILAGSRLGEQVTIFPNAVLYEETIVGPRSTIHAGAVLGAHGFGYESVDGRHQLAPQLGGVEVGPDVDIGACSTIDRGTYGATLIGEGTKIDNLVMVGHNCRIGKHNMICSQVGIAGSCTTGDYVVMAGQVGLRDHIRIGERASIGAKSGVGGDLADGESYLGIPALPIRQQMQIMFTQQKLPDMKKRLRQLERAVEKMEQEAAPPKEMRHSA